MKDYKKKLKKLVTGGMLISSLLTLPMAAYAAPSDYRPSVSRGDGYVTAARTGTNTYSLNAPDGTVSDVQWYSSNENVMRVVPNADGSVTVIGSGATLVGYGTYTDADGNPSVYTVTVPVASTGGGGGSSSGGGGSSSGGGGGGSSSGGGSTSTETTTPSTTIADEDVPLASGTGTTTTTIEDEETPLANAASVLTKTNEDGSKTTTVTSVDGVVSKTTVSSDGTATTVATVSTLTQEQATAKTPIKIALLNSIIATNSSDDSKTTAQEKAAATITVEVPKVSGDISSDTGTGKTDQSIVRFEVPAENVKNTTVAYLLKEDGSKQLIRSTRDDTGNMIFDMPAGTNATLRFEDNAKTFDDVGDAHWGKKEIDYVAAHEWMKGTADGEFSPNASMTAAMVAQVMMNYFGGEAEAVDTSVLDNSDVKDNHWGKQALAYAVNNGYMQGDGNGKFNPDEAISRARVFTLWFRTEGVDPSTVDLSVLDQFEDSDTIPDYAKPAVAYYVKAGILNGVGENKLGANFEITRAEFTAMLGRLDMASWNLD